MASFITKHAHAVIGTLSGFDRLVFRGTLRFLSYTAGMSSYLWTMKVLLKDFATHAQELTQRVRAASRPWPARPGAGRGAPAGRSLSGVEQHQPGRDRRRSLWRTAWRKG